MSEEVKVVVTLNKAQYENLQSMPYGSIGAKLIYDKIKKCKLLSEVLDEIKGEITKGQAYSSITYISNVIEIIDQHIGKGDKE